MSTYPRAVTNEQTAQKILDMGELFSASMHMAGSGDIEAWGSRFENELHMEDIRNFSDQLQPLLKVPDMDIPQKPEWLVGDPGRIPKAQKEAWIEEKREEWAKYEREMDEYNKKMALFDNYQQAVVRLLTNNNKDKLLKFLKENPEISIFLEKNIDSLRIAAESFENSLQRRETSAARKKRKKSELSEAKALLDDIQSKQFNAEREIKLQSGEEGSLIPRSPTSKNEVEVQPYTIAQQQAAQAKLEAARKRVIEGRPDDRVGAIKVPKDKQPTAAIPAAAAVIPPEAAVKVPPPVEKTKNEYEFSNQFQPFSFSSESAPAPAIPNLMELDVVGLFNQPSTELRKSILDQAGGKTEVSLWLKNEALKSPENANTIFRSATITNYLEPKDMFEIAYHYRRTLGFPGSDISTENTIINNNYKNALSAAVKSSQDIALRVIASQNLVAKIPIAEWSSIINNYSMINNQFINNIFKLPDYQHLPGFIASLGIKPNVAPAPDDLQRQQELNPIKIGQSPREILLGNPDTLKKHIEEAINKHPYGPVAGAKYVSQYFTWHATADGVGLGQVFVSEAFKYIQKDGMEEIHKRYGATPYTALNIGSQTAARNYSAMLVKFGIIKLPEPKKSAQAEQSPEASKSSQEIPTGKQELKRDHEYINSEFLKQASAEAQAKQQPILTSYNSINSSKSAPKAEHQAPKVIKREYLEPIMAALNIEGLKNVDNLGKLTPEYGLVEFAKSNRPIMPEQNLKLILGLLEAQRKRGDLSEDAERALKNLDDWVTNKTSMPPKVIKREYLEPIMAALNIEGLKNVDNLGKLTPEYGLVEFAKSNNPIMPEQNLKLILGLLEAQRKRGDLSEEAESALKNLNDWVTNKTSTPPNEVQKSTLKR